MNINELIMNGASEEEIAKAIAEAKYEKARKDEEARKAKEAKNSHKEILKAEARAYLINALIGYAEAFDLMSAEEVKELDQEDLDAIEKAIIKFESAIPVYLKLADWENEFFKGLL